MCQTDRDREHERLLYWAHSWQRLAMHCTRAGPWSRLPAIDRRIVAAMRRCADYSGWIPRPHGRRRA